MRDVDIAIIGMSGVFPEARDLNAFYRNLCEGRDSVRDIPDERRESGRLQGNNYQINGVLDRIDLFDHSFFSISKFEADYMDPHHRMALQLAYAAIEHAGYSLSQVSKACTGVAVAVPNRGYEQLLDDVENVKLMGVLPANMAGRLSHILDLRGPGIVIDTSCSSSLVAVINACNELLLGNADYMLAGGVNLFIDFPLKGHNGMGISAADGKCRAFSATANGTGWGEGGGMVLLKKYSQAMADRDNVLAVIRAGACFQSGKRTIAISAPSRECQEDVAIKALQKGAVNPENVGYLEAHGTGTLIGDSLEIQGLSNVFARFTDKRQFCALGTVKTNIGHLNVAAGIAGLIKTVLSVKNKQKFPSLHFDKPNPHIDFSLSPFYVNTQLEPWEEEHRVAAVNSLGINGSYAHLVIASASPVRPADASEQQPVMIKLSAKSRHSLQGNMLALQEYLYTTTDDLADIAFTLNSGRDDHQYRMAVTGSTAKELADKIRSGAGQLQEKESPAGMKKLYLFLSPDACPSEPVCTVLSDRYRIFRENFDACTRYGTSQVPEALLKGLAFQFAFSQLLLSRGVEITEILTTGFSDVIVSALLEEMTLAEAMSAVKERLDEPEDFNKDKFEAYISDASGRDALVFIEMNETAPLSAAVHAAQAAGRDVSVVRPAPDDNDPFLTLIGALYEHGVHIDWDCFYKGVERYRVAAPGYCFESTSCWENDSVADDRRYELTTVHPGAGSNTACLNISEVLNSILSGVLNLPHINPHDNLLDLGIHSLLAMRAVNEIKKQLGIDVGFDVLFNYTSIAELTAHLEKYGRTAAKSHADDIVHVEDQPHYGLSHAQRRLWVLGQLEEEQIAYNISCGYRFRGVLDRTAFERSLQTLTERHEILRTRFVIIDGEPRQQVHAPEDAGFNLVYEDLSGNGHGAALAESIAREEASFTFDLAAGPLLRARLLKLGDTEHIFLLTMHHIITDGWSMEILIKETLLLYKAFKEGGGSPLEPLPLQYRDFVSWQHQQLAHDRIGAHRDYWLSRFQNGAPVLELPTDKPRPPVKRYGGDRVYFVLDEEKSMGLQQLARSANASLFITLVATVNALLYRYTNQEDIVIGSVVAGRDHPDLESQIGFYVNTLALRNQFSGEDSFGQLLLQVRNTTLQAYDHQVYPFDMLVDALSLSRDMNRSPLFDVMVGLQNTSTLSDAGEMDGIDVEGYGGWLVEASKFDLRFNFTLTDEGLSLYIEYDTDLFEESTIRRMCGHYDGLVGAILGNKQMPINELDYIQPEEKEMLSVFAGAVETAPPGKTIISLFEEHAINTPDAVAVRYGQTSLSYRELNEQVNRLAHYLRRQYGLKPGDVAGLMAGRSERLVIGLLAILKSGAAYLPVDLHFPGERKRQMLMEAGVKVLLTDSDYMFDVGEVYNGELVVLDIQLRMLEEPADNPAAMAAPCDLAYIIYTSGSTGVSKGVAVMHASLFNYVDWFRSEYNIGINDSTLLLSSVAFDLCYTSLWGALASGACLHLLPEFVHFDPSGIAEMLGPTGITYLKLTPSHFSLLVNNDDFKKYTADYHLRLILLGGEEIRMDDVEQYMDSAPHTLFVNHYGPTETTIGTITQRITRSMAGSYKRCPALGKPISNNKVYILDARGRMVPVGVAGEICIAGKGLARGYLNREALNKEKFLPDPFQTGDKMYCTGDLGKWTPDGTVIFLGRKDNQVKISGYRVEPAEIENAILKYPGIMECVVIPVKGAHGKMLAAYFTAGSDPGVAALRAHLSDILPEYMIPTYFVQLAEMPLTPNGKISRKALPEPEASAMAGNVAYVSAGNKEEETLVSIWQEVLGREPIGIHDNFFEIGGTSLKIIQVFNQVHKLYPQVKIANLFNFPLISQQAAFIRSMTESAGREVPDAITEVDF